MVHRSSSKDRIEHFLTTIFSELRPEGAGKSYLVVGTLEKNVWKRGVHDPLMTQEVLDALHDFKEVVTFQLVGGWETALGKYPIHETERT